MVQTTQSVRPCLRKPHLPTIDLDKLVEEAKDVKWFEWDGDPVHKVRPWATGLPMWCRT